ncbi:MAG: hypothetical protein IPN84_17380 [Sphingomonadales bacterium]|nr:hypothetical protein [Sphingomonadales bacterium]
MSGNYEDIGSFDTQEEINQWAARNNIDRRDISIQQGRKLRVAISRDTTNLSDQELRESRRNGFF